MQGLCDCIALKSQSLTLGACARGLQYTLCVCVCVCARTCVCVVYNQFADSISNSFMFRLFASYSSHRQMPSYLSTEIKYVSLPASDLLLSRTGKVHSRCLATILLAVFQPWYTD